MGNFAMCRLLVVSGICWPSLAKLWLTIISSHCKPGQLRTKRVWVWQVLWVNFALMGAVGLLGMCYHIIFCFLFALLISVDLAQIWHFPNADQLRTNRV